MNDTEFMKLLASSCVAGVNPKQIFTPDLEQALRVSGFLKEHPSVWVALCVEMCRDLHLSIKDATVNAKQALADARM